MILKNKSVYYRNISIISGKLRGYKLKTTNKCNLRPTTSRMRETLFNWLTPIIQQASCLDCFAGSGALSLEAISRGASSVTMLENNFLINSILIKNFMNIFNKDKNINIIHVDCIYWLINLKKHFDIIFIDPPFYLGIIKKVITIISANICIKNTYIYLENEFNLFFSTPNNWILYKKKIYGQVSGQLYYIN